MLHKEIPVSEEKLSKITMVFSIFQVFSEFTEVPLSLRDRSCRSAGIRPRKLHIPRFRAGREISSVSLFLLFPREPLHWARAGAPSLESP